VGRRRHRHHRRTVTANHAPHPPGDLDWLRDTLEQLATGRAPDALLDDTWQLGPSLQLRHPAGQYSIRPTRLSVTVALNGTPKPYPRPLARQLRHLLPNANIRVAAHRAKIADRAVHVDRGGTPSDGQVVDQATWTACPSKVGR